MKDIYHEELVVPESSVSRNVMLYLDFLIDMSNGDLCLLNFDKRDVFDVHIVNFPDLSGNIPTTPAFMVRTSQFESDKERLMKALTDPI